MLLWKTVLVDLRHWNLSDVKISKFYYEISWKKFFENDFHRIQNLCIVREEPSQKMLQDE